MTSRGGDPPARIDHRIGIFWTRTGELADWLDHESGWDWADALEWATLGSVNITVPVTGRRTPLGRYQREQLRLLEREGMSLTAAVVRLHDQRVMAAGPIVDLDASTDYKITCASLGKLTDSRMLIRNPYWGAPNDNRGDLSFTLGTRDLVLELLSQACTGYRRNLPLIIPTQSGTTGPQTAYKAEDLVTCYEAIKKACERDDGPEVRLAPELYDDAGAPRLRWLAEVGTPLLGNAAGYRDGDPLPTWDWNAGVIDLDYRLSFDEMVSTGYVPGDSVGTTDRVRIIGVHVVDRGGDYLPALERADRTNASSTNVVELNAQARSYVQAYAYPTADWTITVDSRRWPLLGSGWRLGDLARVRTVGHPLLDDGEYRRRIVAAKDTHDGKLSLTTSDGSEIGLPRWRP